MHYSVIVQVRQMYSQYVRPVALHLRNVPATVNVNHHTKYTKKKQQQQHMQHYTLIWATQITFHYVHCINRTTPRLQSPEGGETLQRKKPSICLIPVCLLILVNANFCPH